MLCSLPLGLRLFCFASLLPSASFFVFTLFGDVAFSEYFCTITIFSLYGEYVVRFFLPGGVFLPCDHGLDLLHHLILCENSIIQINNRKGLFV